VFIKCFQNWCPGCHRHGFPTLKKVIDAFGNDERVAILAIQTVFEGHFFNSGSKVRALQKRYKLPIKMAHDPGSNGSDRSNTLITYRTGGTPWMIIADPSGRVVFNDFHVNADGLIEFLKQQLSA